jgi:hypothetical protein
VAGSVGCFIEDCDNPVIGQCPGYEGSCGQFYCHAHSIQKMCSECGGRKAYNDTVERIYCDYLETAKSIKKPPNAILSAIFIGMLIGGMTMMNLAPLVIVCLVLICIFYCLIQMDNRKKFVKSIADIEKTKPGFSEFYRMYRAEKSKELSAYFVREAVGMLGAGLMGAVKGGAKAAMRPPDYTSAHFTGINKALDDIKKKLD